VAEDTYRKTDKGRDEIATRANKLGLRERTMLIMVDDKTSRAGLLAKNPHPTSEGILDDLLAGGYIEIVGGTVAAASAPPPLRASPGPGVCRSRPGPRHPRRRCSGRPTGRSIDAIGFALRLPHAGYPAGSGGGRPDDAGRKVQDSRRTYGPARKVPRRGPGHGGRRKAEEFWAGASARLPKA
jgi:hypothetical protein